MINNIITFIHVVGALSILGIAIYSLIVFAIIPVKNYSQASFLKLKTLSIIAGIASLSQLITGSIMIAGDWDEFGHNPLVWFKIILWVIAGYIARYSLQNHVIKVSQSIDKKEIPNASRFRMIVFVNFAFILSIFVIGFAIAD